MDSSCSPSSNQEPGRRDSRSWKMSTAFWNLENGWINLAGQKGEDQDNFATEPRKSWESETSGVEVTNNGRTGQKPKKQWDSHVHFPFCYHLSSVMPRTREGKGTKVEIYCGGKKTLRPFHAQPENGQQAYSHLVQVGNQRVLPQGNEQPKRKDVLTQKARVPEKCGVPPKLTTVKFSKGSQESLGWVCSHRVTTKESLELKGTRKQINPPRKRGNREKHIAFKNFP